MQLTTHGLKARDHQVDLDGLTLLVGPNGSGKSSVADSIRFLALGFIPSLGKRPLDTAVLMSDRELSVDLALPKGRSIRRTLTRTEKGYQVGAECSWLRNAKASEASKEITALFGAEELDVAECLDIRQLLAATPNQRAARLEQLLSAGRRTPEETASAVARLTVMRLIPNLPEDRMPEDYKQALPMVGEGHVQVLTEVGGMLEAKVGESGITGALTWANEEKRLAAAGLNQKTQAEAELRLRASEVPEPDEREIKRLEGERDGVQRQLGAVVQQRTEYDRKRARRAAIEAAIRQAQQSAWVAGESYTGAESVKAMEIADMEARRSKLQEQLDGFLSPPEPDRTKITDLLDEDEKLEADLAERGSVPEVPWLPGELQSSVETIEQRLKEARKNPWTEVLKIAIELKKLKEVLGRARRLEEIARAGLKVTAEDLEHELDVKRKELSAATKAHDKAVAAAEKVEASRKKIEDRRRAITTEAHELEIAIQRARAQSMQTYREHRANLEDAIQAIDRGIAQRDHVLRTLLDEKAAADKRLASLQDELRGVGEIGPEPQDPAALEQQLGHVREALDKLIRARAVHGEIQAVLDSIEAAKARREVMAAVEWALQRQREIEISSAGGPLLKTMQEFFQAAGRHEQPFIRAGAGSCAIGWRTVDGEEINVAALSGGEFALFAAALTSAVILCRTSTLKVLLVEAGETDDRHLAQILQGVRAVSQDGATMHAIVMVPRSPVFEAAGWTTVPMVEGMPAAAEKVA